MAFEFFKTITDYIDPVVDFLVGEKEYESGDVVGRSGGFLEKIVKPGAEAYVAMTASDKDKEAFTAPTYKEPRIRRFSGQAPRAAGQTSPLQILGASDPRVNKFLKNFTQKAYANADMNRLSRDLRVAMNRRQGQRTIGLEPARQPVVKEAAPAQVRRHEKDVV